MGEVASAALARTHPEDAPGGGRPLSVTPGSDSQHWAAGLQYGGPQEYTWCSAAHTMLVREWTNWQRIDRSTTIKLPLHNVMM